MRRWWLRLKKAISLGLSDGGTEPPKAFGGGAVTHLMPTWPY